MMGEANLIHLDGVELADFVAFWLFLVNSGDFVTVIHEDWR